jgi:hypothetical protein
VDAKEYLKNDKEYMKTSEMLRDIALYLEGLKAGKGDLLPLGLTHLKELWLVVKDYQAIEKKTEEVKERE